MSLRLTIAVFLAYVAGSLAAAAVPGYERKVLAEAYGGHDGITLIAYEKRGLIDCGRAWLVKVDLSKGYRIRTQHGRGEGLRANVKELAEQMEADGLHPICGVNADFFYQNQFPDALVHAHSTGMCITDGRMVHPGHDNNADMHMRFLMELEDHSIVHGVPERTDGLRKGNPTNVTQVAYRGRGILNAVRTCWGRNNYPVQNGVIVTNLSWRTTDPRTMVGLGRNAEGHDQIVLYVSDGRQPGWSLGVSVVDGARMMIAEGCTDVAPFDGGGSSTMWAKGYGKGPRDVDIVNRTSDGKLRRVANGLFILPPPPGIGKPYDQPIDTRPDEFRHANRTQDEFPPWVDFETETGWMAEAVGAGDAVAYRSDEHQLFGTNTLAVRTRNATEVLIRPRTPLALPADHAWVGVWIRTKREKGPLSFGVKPDYGIVVIGPDGTRRRMPLFTYCRSYDKTLNWTDWHYVTHVFTADERAFLDRPGVLFDGFYVEISKETPIRSYDFDNLAFFTPDDGKKLDLVTVPQVLKPTRPEGMEPQSVGPNGRSAREGDRFVYTGDDGKLEYFWKGDLDTLEASWNGGPRFRPAAYGGVYGGTAAAHYAPHLVGKTLVVEVTAPAGVTRVSMGRPSGAREVAGTYVPMMSDGWTRSQVKTLDDGKSRFFTLAFNDLYFSEASYIGDSLDAAGVTNRAALYQPLTDGRLNPVRERVYVTVSPRLDDLLPVIANAPSPWRYETGSRAWCAYASSADRAFDKRFWKHLYDLGIRRVTIGDHESCMRDEGESFTFRDRPAPGKGGDEGWRDYTDYLINTLGFRYGPYNNFTDFAPVNAEWRFDRASRTEDGNLKPAWIRCYAPKPQWAYEAALRFPASLKRKFGFNTGYCDVHTAFPPWMYTDFDARCEGAGRFGTVYNAYAAILKEQKRVWNGPVYSEGNSQWLYAGYVDGNYGQDAYNFERDPWIVDFDVRRIHPLEGDFGMGNLDMFAVAHPAPRRTDDPLLAAEVDRFLAATLAFGHAPYLLFETLFNVRKCHALAYPDPKAYYDPETGLPYTLRSYHMVLPASERYARATAREILYLDPQGVWRDVSGMLLKGEKFFCQVAVSYSDGTHVVANGERTRRLKGTVFGRAIDLPPLGYAVWSDDGALDIVSSDATGARVDYSASPDAIFLDTRDSANEVVFPKARGKGLAVRFRDGTGWKTLVLRGSVTFTP